jgi:hypothetical protein
MLMEASWIPLNAESVSVNGVKTTFAAFDVPAFCATQTPPPVVPM